MASYNSLINAAGDNNEIALAQVVFQEAKDKNIDLNAISYSSLINAAGKNHDLTLGKAIFAEAFHKQKVDTATYNILLDILIQHNHIAEAITYFKGCQGFTTLALDAPQKPIDLHSFSHGSTYILLYFIIDKHFNQAKEILSLSLIIGKGLHSKHKDDQAIHPVKQGVLHFIHDFSSQYAFTSSKMMEGCMAFEVIPLAALTTESANDEIKETAPVSGTNRKEADAFGTSNLRTFTQRKFSTSTTAAIVKEEQAPFDRATYAENIIRSATMDKPIAKADRQQAIAQLIKRFKRIKLQAASTFIE